MSTMAKYYVSLTKFWFLKLTSFGPGTLDTLYLPVRRTVCSDVKPLPYKLVETVQIILVHLLNSVFCHICLSEAVMRTLEQRQ